MSYLTALFATKIAPILAGLLAAAAGIFGIYRKGKRKATNEIQRRQVDEYVGRVEQSVKVGREVVGLSDADIDKRMSDKGWRRE